jgi:hypothetical protein
MKILTRPKALLPAVLILILLCLGFGAYTGIDFIQNLSNGKYLNAATSAAQSFLQHIHSGDIDAAYTMLSEMFQPQITRDQFVGLVQQDKLVFSTYRQFRVCEWGLYMDKGMVVDLHGLVDYDNGALVTQITLHRDSDAVWRVQGFRLDSSAIPRPFGICK